MTVSGASRERSSTSQHTIAGRQVTMPVEIRQATQHAAFFSVDADAAQRLIDYSGLSVCRYRPGRAVAILMLVHYVDGDLGRYHEFGTSVMVNPPGSDAKGLRALQSAGAFIHHLPVDQAFTLEAGQKIWGYPKVMADFTIRDGRHFGFDVNIDGRFVIGMEFRAGLPLRLTPRTQVQRSYSHRDGVTLETQFEMTLDDVRNRPGGVRMRLGDHPYAKELALLGLPKRAMLAASAQTGQMSFGDARPVC